MKKYFLLIALILGMTFAAQAQPEFYADPYVGLPEFRVLPLRMATAHPDSILIEVHVRIVYDDLQFVKLDDHYQASYNLDLFLDRDKDERVAMKHVDRIISVNEYYQTNSRLLDDHTIAHLAGTVGDYSLRLVLTDQESRKERILERKISFPENEWGSNLRLSDLAPLDSSGTVQMMKGIVSGQEVRVAFNLYSEADPPPRVEFLVQNEKDEVIAYEKIPLPENSRFYADTLRLPATTFTGIRNRLIVKAHTNQVELARVLTLKAISENLPDYIQDLDQSIRQLKYIAEPQEIQRMLVAPQWRREELFLEYWKKKDSNTVTTYNEKMNEYYRRVQYSNEHFRGRRDGWETDRGKIYIIFGSPTDIDRHPFDMDKKPYEIWYYDDLARRFLFVDEDGFGDFRLRSPLLRGY